MSLQIISETRTRSPTVCSAAASHQMSAPGGGSSKVLGGGGGPTNATLSFYDCRLSSGDTQTLPV